MPYQDSSVKQGNLGQFFACILLDFKKNTRKHPLIPLDSKNDYIYDHVEKVYLQI